MNNKFKIIKKKVVETRGKNLIRLLFFIIIKTVDLLVYNIYIYFELFLIVF